MTISVLLLSITCASDPKSPEVSFPVITSGTSFGFCAGYCIRELTISDGDFTFEAKSWNDPNFPDKKIEGTISADDWDSLVGNINLKFLFSYDNVLGCPDCADGGAEWIEVQTEDTLKKITFEYGDTLTSIQPLIDAVRELRERFDKEMFP